MFLTVVNLAKKTKSKYILVRMLSEAGTGCSFNVKRLRLQDKLVMLSYDRFVKQKVLFKEQKKICSV
ncbi:39S ribosomal protein L33, mitochondrial isoform X2 [Pseudonaja textilis]|uniref:Large ribosomal subunit protein bL33m n=2 Tax=Hydrophiinae TaxID=292440 RepID=A0A670Y9F2_PSETE|nr:39S ribosomal protein L33, mitochondrial isoform X2 [Notechis scutatus]XP_026551399.1 39S ribosomal protein L33, mitochondrial isoform X2 [Pseudonaja textilis]